MGSYSVTKLYRDIPIGHRQHKHDGHCKYMHGHNWDIELTFQANSLDEVGFVVDFGKLQFVKKWIEKLDHAFLIARDDTELQDMIVDYPTLFKPYVIDSASAEGLAREAAIEVNKEIYYNMNRDYIDRTLRCVLVRIFEDSHDIAIYNPTADELRPVIGGS